MNLNNPFLVRGYSGSEYFCDREDETSKIVSSLTNEGDVTLIAPRRYGKTGLIHNVFNQIKNDQTVVYIDIYATRNLAEFTKLFVTSVVGALDTKVEKAMSVVARFFKSCRPTMTPQEFGMPKFSFDVAPSNAEATLKVAFDYLRSREKRMVIAIDEFQQVLEYPEKGAEALLRSYMQFVPFVHFIFAGSRQHLMREMFLSPKHPFYQSTDIVSLRTIDRAAYLKFARRFFVNKRKPFDDEAFRWFYDRFDGITWYVQMVLRQLWTEGRGLPDISAAEDAVDSIVESRTFEYLDLLKAQNESSQELLRALAIDGPVAEPLSGEFLSRHASLRATSTVASALKDLQSCDLVYKTDRGFVVYDRFFGVWLSRLPR